MLDPKQLRTDLSYIAAQLSRRGFILDTAKLDDLEQERRQAQAMAQALQTERNQRSKKIGQAKGRGEDIAPLLAEVEAITTQHKAAEVRLAQVLEKIEDYSLTIPNLLADDVPDGRDEKDNQEVMRWGEPTEMSWPIQDHVSLGESCGMDFESAAKLSGARFVTLQGTLARLQRALTQFMLDYHSEQHGYTEAYLPYLVNQQALQGTGQLPKFADDLFAIEDSSLYLIPTAEVPLTNLVREKIVDAAALPLKWVAHTPCFRREAGSHGRDVRGLIRQHQFEKVELVQVVPASEAEAAHQQLTSDAEAILQALQLPYRKMLLCAGDTGFSARKTYDLEVWLPSQQTYREISSCSQFGDFQARRMQARWRNPETGKTEYLHTLNGSGLAVGRTLLAIMENYQRASGVIAIPTVLQPYMSGKTTLNE